MDEHWDEYRLQAGEPRGESSAYSLTLTLPESLDTFVTEEDFTQSKTKSVFI